MFELIQIIYWISLSTWFGGVLFLSIVAPIIVKTVRETKPILPSILSVNLEGQHGTLLGGMIIGQIMKVLFPIELICAGGMLIALVGQWVMLPVAGREIIFPLIRAALYLAAVALLIYHWRIVWPKMWRYRQEYIDHADEPDVANPALDQFDKYQNDSATAVRNLVFLLLGMILFSASVMHPTTTLIFQK